MMSIDAVKKQIIISSWGSGDSIRNKITDNKPDTATFTELITHTVIQEPFLFESIPEIPEQNPARPVMVTAARKKVVYEIHKR